ncbi:ATP phosphoribosyltransferase regulatory subunit [Aerococcus urinaeequi]|uniref:ATP phosphoribosyltransferase regulatory subunit n=1 Tax=Aerococcus urinaeequi TaxID=51665 RepID=UPI003AADE9DA
MATSYVLQRISLARDYLETVLNAGFQLIDLNMVEPFDGDGKAEYPSNIVFEKEGQLYAIRSDWTRSILNYMKTYDLKQDNFAYYGPMVRDHQSTYQAGVELVEPSASQMANTIELHLDFVEQMSQASFNMIVVNNEEILDKYIEKFAFGPEIKGYVIEKNLSALGNTIGKDHYFYQLMAKPVSEQFDLVKKDFGDTDEMAVIHLLKETLERRNTKMVLDLSFRSPQKYYNGFYFQAFLQGNSKPIFSGGQYANGWFGIGLNLSKGGFL